MDFHNFSFRRWFVTIFFTLLAIAAYVVGYRVTEINPVKLFTSLPKSQKILSDLIHPELFTHKTQETTFDVVFPVPCGSAQPTQLPDTGPRIVPTVSCANPGDIITLQGVGMLPNQDIKIEWLLPSGRNLFSKLAKADASGNFTAQVEVRPINATTTDGTPSHLQVETSVPVGGWIPSSTLTDVLDNIIVTVFMALLATTAGTIVAAPISFLAARNIMGRNWVGTAVYTTVRAILNITRSYESLVLATVFALWVGFGAFAGVLALTVVTIASLGKLFSEAVESIDSGPIEAVSATGANPVEVVLYAVVPQIIPDFISFIIYHWDINVRISTILGFVGGGGIGFYLSQRINVLEYRKAGTAIWAIVLVVWAMDFLSAEVRKRYT
jgi:phosphonate transport system permease protein